MATTGSEVSQPDVILDPFYEYYKHRGFAVELLGPVIPMVLLAVAGLFGNICVALATWKTRSLHGACNYLLAIGGLCDSVHQALHFIFLYITATGTNFIPYSLCTKLQAIPLAGLNYGLLMTLFVGLDRLLSVFFPMMHRSMPKACYVGCFLLFGALYNAFWFYHIFSYAATHSDL
ncbi:Protein SRSX-25 a, partial [Aphelenchoides avenae]